MGTSQLKLVVFIVNFALVIFSVKLFKFKSKIGAVRSLNIRTAVRSLSRSARSSQAVVVEFGCRGQFLHC
jgi:hypothetical protein